jgi:hypothetical protein
MNPFQEKGIPIDEQILSWSELNTPAYDPVWQELLENEISHLEMVIELEKKYEKKDYTDLYQADKN